MLILILLYTLYLTISISFHEFAHAFAADRLGDPTPRAAGRLTLNPFAHIDLVGTLLLPLGLMLLSSFTGTNFVFGWGKPTPFDPYNLKNPRRDAAIISVAGPISNLILAVIFSVIAHFVPYYYFPFITPMIWVNITLAVFNLFPVSPLDGSKIIVGILPRDLAYEYQSIMNRYGVLILILLVFPVFGNEAPIHSLMAPIVSFIAQLLLPNI